MADADGARVRQPDRGYRGRRRSAPSLYRGGGRPRHDDQRGEDPGTDSDDWVTELLDDLPHTQYDEDWQRLRDLLFPDRDFEMLNNPALDGIEDDDELQRHLGMDLRPQFWFRTYPWAQPRHPLRGFRRLDPD